MAGNSIDHGMRDRPVLVSRVLVLPHSCSDIVRTKNETKGYETPNVKLPNES